MARRDKGAERALAGTRIHALLAAGRAEVGGPDEDLADRHGNLALRLTRKYQRPLSSKERAQLCRKCGAIKRSNNTRVRLTGGRITTTCLACNATHRRPLEQS